MKQVLAVSATVVASLFVHGTNQSSSMADYAATMQGTKTLRATVTTQWIGGELKSYSVELAKPNLVRIESDTELCVSNGTVMFVYSKGDKSFTKRPASDAHLKSILSADDYCVIAGFLDPSYCDDFVTERSQGKKKLRGTTFDVTTASSKRDVDATVTFYFDPADKIAKIIEVRAGTGTEARTLIASFRSLERDITISESAFQFIPPAGATDVSSDAPVKVPRTEMPNIDGFKTLPQVALMSCCPSATSNGLAWLSMNGFSGFANENFTATERATQIAKDLLPHFKTDSTGTTWANMFTGLSQYLRERGYPRSSFGIYSWVYDSKWPGVKRLGATMPSLDVIKEAQTRNSFVMLSIGWVNNPDANGKCLQTMWHWATVADVDSKEATVTLHDPYQSKNPTSKPLVLRLSALASTSNFILTGNQSHNQPDRKMAGMYVLQNYPNCSSNQFAYIIGAVVVTVAK